MPENISLSVPRLQAQISDWRAKGDECYAKAEKLQELLDLAISMDYGDTIVAEAKPRRGRPPVSVPSRRNLPGEVLPLYRDMSTREAAIDYLRRKGSPAGATEIAQALKDGGKQSTSTLFNRTVDNTLKGAMRKKNPLVEKVKGGWALTEWRGVHSNTISA